MNHESPTHPTNLSLVGAPETEWAQPWRVIVVPLRAPICSRSFSTLRLDSTSCCSTGAYKNVLVKGKPELRSYAIALFGDLEKILSTGTDGQLKLKLLLELLDLFSDLSTCLKRGPVSQRFRKWRGHTMGEGREGIEPVIGLDG